MEGTMYVSNFCYSEAIGVQSLKKALDNSSNPVLLSWWREEFNKMYDTKNDGAKRKAFCMAKKKMIEDGFITFSRRWLIAVDIDKLNKCMGC